MSGGNLVFGVLLLLILVLLFDTPRLRFRRFCRFILYENVIADSLRNKFLQLFFPSITGAYFLCLDVWGSEWDVIKNNKEEHELIFAFVLLSSLIIMFVRATADWYEGKSDKAYIQFLEQFTYLTSSLVNRKLERFKDKARSLTKTGDTFKQITEPKLQINTALDGIEDLLLKNFSIKKTQVSITVIHRDPKTKKWYYLYETNRGWNHTKPDTLVSSESTVSKCLDTGEPIFHASKQQASRMKEYYISDRDRRTGDGSVFCYPAFTDISDYRDDYLISIVTYGKRLCDPLDRAQCEAICEIFSEICRRLDLELTLQSIKKWKFG